MSSSLNRSLRYLAALIESKLDRAASPRIQLEQAAAEARRHHQLLTEQAAAVLGNEHELETRVQRAVASVERLRSATAQALLLADRATQAGDQRQAEEHERTATLFAVQLGGAESVARDLGDAQRDAALAAAAARRAVDQSAFLLQARLADGNRLRTRIDNARMQERIADTLAGLDELAPKGSVPTLEEVSDRVDGRLSLAIARTELAQRSAGARMVEIERSVVEEAGRRKLAEMRVALGLPPHQESAGGSELAHDGEGAAGGTVDGPQ